MKRCPKCNGKLHHRFNEIYCNRCGYSQAHPMSVREMRMTDELLRSWLYADIVTITDCYSASEGDT